MDELLILLRNNKQCRDTIWKALKEGPAANGLSEDEWKTLMAILKPICKP